MDKTLAAERRLRDMACPLCDTAGSLQIAVRCELAYGECRYTVRCQRCGVVFELSRGGRPAEPHNPGLGFRLSRLACPACGGVGAELLFRCDVPSRSCFYLVTCKRCGREHKE